eukprot:COSAG05_NODE_11559_length_507_cov_1.497549_1_plen_91_part_01
MQRGYGGSSDSRLKYESVDALSAYQMWNGQTALNLVLPDEQEAANAVDQTRISMGIHRAVQDVHDRCLSSATAGEETGNDEELKHGEGKLR